MNLAALFGLPQSQNLLPSQENMAQQTSLAMPIQHGIVGDLVGNPFAHNQDQVGLVVKPPPISTGPTNPFDQLRQALQNQNGLLTAGQAFGTPGSYGDAIEGAAKRDQTDTMMSKVMQALGNAQPQVGQAQPQLPVNPNSKLKRSRSRMPDGNSYGNPNGLGPPGSPDFDPTPGSGNF